jgi:hypothetical protein
MTDLLGIIVFNAVLFFSLILSLPASALAQQEVDPTYYESAAPQTASIEHSAKTANKDKAPKQVSKAHKQAARNKNAQSLVAKK